jgi:hypothetical protein
MRVSLQTGDPVTKPSIINGSHRKAVTKHLYSLVSGEVVEYPDQSATVNAFIARVTAAVNDPAVSPAELLALVYGTENPILDTTTQPGRAIVTKAVFENPVYRVLADLVGRKQLLAAGQALPQAAMAYTMSVKDTSTALNLTESSVRTAIHNRKLSAVKRNGDWYVHPNSVASYKVSNRGRKKAAPDSSEAKPVEPSVAVQPSDAAAEHEVNVICGSMPGGSLAVRIVNGELVGVIKTGHLVSGQFPPGWTKAAVKTTTGNGVRVFELEPEAATDAELPHEVRHLGFMVAGEFKIVKKHNATKAAVEVWKKYAGEAASS